MILAMKAISVGFDIDSKQVIRPPSVSGFLGYVFHPGSIIFGPWVSYSEYADFRLYKQKKFVSTSQSNTFILRCHYKHLHGNLVYQRRNTNDMLKIHLETLCSKMLHVCPCTTKVACTCIVVTVVSFFSCCLFLYLPKGTPIVTTKSFNFRIFGGFIRL